MKILKLLVGRKNPCLLSRKRKYFIIMKKFLLGYFYNKIKKNYLRANSLIQDDEGQGGWIWPPLSRGRQHLAPLPILGWLDIVSSATHPYPKKLILFFYSFILNNFIFFPFLVIRCNFSTTSVISKDVSLLW